MNFSDEQIEVIKTQVTEWDMDKSVKRACEELSELQTALLHYDRGKCDVVNVLEEMADVAIAIEHLQIKFGSCQLEVNKRVGKDA